MEAYTLVALSLPGVDVANYKSSSMDSLSPLCLYVIEGGDTAG
ncbi:hypothetical protein [Aerococcus urinaeequi]|nr:hypothetical protein [Aerococcus urinaeequi]